MIENKKVEDNLETKQTPETKAETSTATVKNSTEKTETKAEKNQTIDMKYVNKKFDDLQKQNALLMNMLKEMQRQLKEDKIVKKVTEKKEEKVEPNENAKRFV